MENSHDLGTLFIHLGLQLHAWLVKEEEDKSLELTWRGNVVAVILMVPVYWD